jgi:F0F1-type ATP synthase epsilon subunit
MKTMRLTVSTPGRELELESLVALRFMAEDGWRGVLPGHEPARARIRGGPVRCVELPAEGAPAARPGAPAPDRLERALAGPVRWLATEGGVILIDRLELRILTRWAGTAESLARLRELVEARDRERERLEEQARTVATRHELATRRALVALERKISLP